MSGVYLDHSIVEQKEKYVQAICTNLCCKNYQSMPNSEDCLAKKLTTSGIHLDDSILDKIKNYFNHCTYMCCKIINQSMPNSEDSLAK